MDAPSITLESMVRHHTKDKGDLAVAKVHADLVSKGFTVLFPATEHAPFNLVSYAAGEFHRLQVKYRSARAGAVTVKFRSMWADRNRTHMAPRSLSGLRPAEMASRQECWTLPHFASCHAQFAADLSGSAFLNDELSRAPRVDQHQRARRTSA